MLEYAQVNAGLEKIVRRVSEDFSIEARGPSVQEQIAEHYRGLPANLQVRFEKDIVKEISLLSFEVVETNDRLMALLDLSSRIQIAGAAEVTAIKLTELLNSKCDSKANLLDRSMQYIFSLVRLSQLLQQVCERIILDDDLKELHVSAFYTLCYSEPDELIFGYVDKYFGHCVDECDLEVHNFLDFLFIHSIIDHFASKASVNLDDKVFDLLWDQIKRSKLLKQQPFRKLDKRLKGGRRLSYVDGAGREVWSVIFAIKLNLDRVVMVKEIPSGRRSPRKPKIVTAKSAAKTKSAETAQIKKKAKADLERGLQAAKQAAASHP